MPPVLSSCDADPAFDVELLNVSKRFGALLVIDDLSLQVRPHEFMVFLGPSGCGKSTLLRMIAGLESIDRGEIRVAGKRIDHLPPGQRGVAMVFQHYALYPHMSVRDNMAFGLRNAGEPAAEIARRVSDAAKMLEIEGLLERKPGQISGGQRQRVAIGRAIVKQPKLFLFDEPLSNLDAALRLRTRVELAQLHQRVGAAMIFVTHDQVEAMTLAHRIVVMNNRRIEQIGTPMEIYTRPASMFVAAFVGTPAMNLIDVTVREGAGRFVEAVVPDGTALATRIEAQALPAASQPLKLGVRAEAVGVCTLEEAHLRGVTTFVERLGDRTLVYVQLAKGMSLVASTGGMSRIKAGDEVGLRLDPGGMHLFASAGAYHAVEEA